MVDNEARKILYDEVINYLHGRIDRKQFINLYSKMESSDMAIWEIQDRMQHIPLDRVSGSSVRLKRPSDRSHVVRMLLFAMSDQEYVWPEDRRDTAATCMMSIFMLIAVAAMGLLWFYQQGWALLAVAVLFFGTVLLFDRVRTRQVRRWQLHGDVEAWPFMHIEEYERAATRYLKLVEEDLPRSMN